MKVNADLTVEPDYKLEKVLAKMQEILAEIRDELKDFNDKEGAK